MVKPTTTDTAIDATTCPERFDHRARLGQLCTGGCNEVIPGGGMYTPGQMARFFPGGAILDQSANPYPQTAEESALWLEYEGLTPLRDAAIDELADAQRGRASVSGTSVVNGNVVVDDSVRERAYRGDAAITAAKKRLEDIRDEGSRLLLDINRLGAIRGAKARRAMFEESFPPAPPARGLLDRAAAAIRGNG